MGPEEASACVKCPAQRNKEKEGTEEGWKEGQKKRPASNSAFGVYCVCADFVAKEQKTSICTTVSFHPLSHQQLSLLQDQLNNGLPLSVDLLNGKRRERK